MLIQKKSFGHGVGHPGGRFCPLPAKALQIPMRAPRKDPWSRPLADLVGPIIDPVLAKRGFGQSDVILYWEEIVGERLAAMPQPLRRHWPPPRARAAQSQPEAVP